MPVFFPVGPLGMGYGKESNGSHLGRDDGLALLQPGSVGTQTVSARAGQPSVSPLASSHVPMQPRYNFSGSGNQTQQQQSEQPETSDNVEWTGSVLIGTGSASVVRIPIPGTNGLCLQLDAPGGYKGSTSTLFFVEDPSNKFGRQLRLDYGPRPATVNGQKVTVIDYHWNREGPAAWGITNHMPAPKAGRYLYTGAKYFKYGGRLLLVAGIVFDVVSIVKTDKPLKRASEVIAGWAGAWLGCKMIGAGGGYVGAVAGSEVPVLGNAIGAAIGASAGCIVGGVGGYWAGSKVAGVAYEWAEGTTFAPLIQASEGEVYLWMRMHGL